MARIAWDNRAHPAYAWKVLTQGVCDGCALGVAGLHDWTIDGVHLCTTRLELLEFNTADAFDPILLSDVEPLAGYTTAELRALGRLGHPMRRRGNAPGFTPISWDEALDAIAIAHRATTPARTAWYLTSRGITNETYYAAGKAARALGIANIDSAARVCHAPSTVGLKQTIGVAASTCSLRDVIESDLVVLWGTNPANNQPVFMKYLDKAVKRGTKVVVVNPYLEPGLDRYWVPSAVESAIFGTKICDLHVPVRPGGDVAFANAVLTRLRERGGVDEHFVAAHTEGWDELVVALDRQPLDELVARRRHRHRHARRVRRPVRRRVERGADLVDGDHPALPRRRGRAGDRQRGPRSRQRRSQRRGAHAHPRSLRCAGRGRDGRVRDRAARRRVHRRGNRRGAGGAVGIRGAGPRRAHRARDDRGRRARRARRAVVVGRQLPRRHARARPGARRPRARAVARPRGCRPHAADAAAGRRRDPAARRHPLRAGGWRHVHHDRTASRVFTRDPASGRRGAQRVAALRRRRGRDATRARRALRLDRQRRAARRDRPGRPRLRGDRAPRGHR